MIEGQLIPALIAQLLIEGVEPWQIEGAVARVRDLELGESVTGDDSLRRAFAFEQAARLSAWVSPRELA